MILTVEVKPNSKETKFLSWRDSSTVLINIKDPAIDGKANRALIKYLSKQLKIPQTYIEIKRGQNGRTKHVILPNGTNLEQLK
ncbi:hypothetical protein COY25_03570 [Candidatus Uhrbacteria bacterium CG_4_10_14_0_2_um_filter_41_7]|uniref:UPF0235 protein CO173_04270 n=1 Tax=Candidatus Uhrbacteria bacterium CG_4_9_14_3_um_filter_41_35 TaxID=1975034 RepID=A0A2M7XDE0_9BACT|nr:MAG: hypothetical protein COV92_03650 [Candidatus Uhrbacteria bacterium CG11_big_fil_rev_8_21_14_0_20_41_9]PIZ53411.1 MAG: hypothetical protein COY25_03570 [Candidatus Uhrbacteria bacterium CG_4_10_14_0_2_um_filter_41_7]PJA45899.1 MAG: hypothetical protein CO173_04270 [Candidatus Uhrbacteria bacterium CG_4_9_14_3_um_filter_41_35]